MYRFKSILKLEHPKIIFPSMIYRCYQFIYKSIKVDLHDFIGITIRKIASGYLYVVYRNIDSWLYVHANNP